MRDEIHERIAGKREQRHADVQQCSHCFRQAHQLGDEERKTCLEDRKRDEIQNITADKDAEVFVAECFGERTECVVVRRLHVDIIGFFDRERRNKKRGKPHHG